MDLLERYLAAIARDLPDAQKADVTAELRDELMTGIEASEEGLGRPLSRDELEAALVDFGHPLVIAGRYRKTQQLIGPEVFPFWWAGLRAALLIVAAIYLVLALLVVIGGEDAAVVSDRTAPSLTVALIFTFGAVTLFCAAVERFGKARILAQWKPRNLPPAQGRRRSRFEITVEIAMGVVVLLWWTGVIHFRNVLPGVGLRLDLAPIWAVWFWPILAYVVGELAMNVIAVLRPAWVRLNGALILTRNLVGAAILGMVVQAERIVTVSAPHIAPSVLEVIQANFDKGFRIGISVTVLLFLAMAAVEAWRLRRNARLNAPLVGV